MIERAWWKPPRSLLSRERARHVTFLELFYDLVYVVLVSEVGQSVARDMRLAVEAYAKQHRLQADEEARGVVAEAERQSSTMREAAEQMVRQVEDDVRRRQEKLRAEVRTLEQRKRDALARLEEIAELLQDVLPSARRDDALVRDLKPTPPSGS